MGQNQADQHLHYRGPRKRKEREEEIMAEEIMAENFLKLGKKIDIQI